MRRGFVVAALASAHVGCAFVAGGFRVSQAVSVETRPPGAVASSGESRCVTPCELDLSRRNDTVVSLSRDGHRPAIVRLRSRTRAATFGDVLLVVGTPIATGIGFAVDFGTGAAFELVPGDVVLELDPLSAPTSAPAVALDGVDVVAASWSVPAAPGAAPALSPIVVDLRPRPPLRLGLQAYAGGGFTRGVEGTAEMGVIATWRPGDVWTFGGAFEDGTQFSLFDPPQAGHRSYAIVAGPERIGSVGRLSLLAALGWHEFYSLEADSTAGGPSVGIRGEASLIAVDMISLGLWLSLGRDLFQSSIRHASHGDYYPVGGTFAGGGVTVGLVAY
jgi:hypothetical protein